MENRQICRTGNSVTFVSTKLCIVSRSLVDSNPEPYLRLAENDTLIHMDLRGHGLSMKSHVPDDYQIKCFVDELRALLR